MRCCIIYVIHGMQIIVHSMHICIDTLIIGLMHIIHIVIEQ
jgi:hypothetical protein